MTVQNAVAAGLPGKSTASVRGNTLAYYRAGSGETLVLLHGITTYSFIWRNMFKTLSEHHDTIAVDLLGCGESEMPQDEDYSIAAQADYIVQLMEGLGVERYHIAGHDVGGGVAQIIAARHPRRVRSLTLINPVGFDYWPVEPIVTMRTPILRRIAMGSLSLGVFRFLIKRGMYRKDRVTDELMDLFWKPLKRREGRRAFLRLAEALDNRQLMGITEKLRKLKMPVLIIRGAADPYFPDEISRRLKREIPGSRIEVIETAGHFLTEDAPARLADFILGNTQLQPPAPPAQKP